MTDDELVKRLREAERGAKKDSREEVLFVEAADEIERLTRERDEAREYAVKRSDEAHDFELALHARADAAERKVERLRETLKAMLREHDILSENDPSVRRGTDRWPTSAGLARAALAETEKTDGR